MPIQDGRCKLCNGKGVDNRGAEGAKAPPDF